MCESVNQTKNKKGKLHELLTVDFARLYRANNGDNMNTQFNKNSLLDNKNYDNANFNCKNLENEKTKGNAINKNHRMLKSTVMLVSWLFVFILSAFLMLLNNGDFAKRFNNLVAEESISTFAGHLNDHKGTKDDPHLISNYVDLCELSDIINETQGSVSGSSTPTNSTIPYNQAHYILTSSIETSLTNWKPIGNIDYHFSGYFDGNGHTVTFTSEIQGITTESVFVMMEYSCCGGLFGYVGDNTTIVNLGVEWKGGLKAYSEYDTYAGGIVAFAEGKLEISNCYSTGTITSQADQNYAAYAGGIVACGKAQIKDCYTRCSINTIATSARYGYAGGILGVDSNYINLTISNCYSTGSVSCSGNDTYAGGIIGFKNKFSITNCFYMKNSVNATNVNSNGFAKSEQELKDINEYSWTDFDKIWAIDETGNINNGYPYLQVFYAPKTVVATISVTTNVGAILNIENESGESVQQIYVSPTTSQPIEMELDLTTYNIIISTYYTTNITTTTPNVTLIGNKLTFDTNNVTQVSITLNSFVGNNGIII